MVKKVQKSSAKSKTKTTSQAASPLSGAIKDSAQQIWLAGLGAFSKAQAEGGKAFETLVKEGLSIQRKTQAVAEERISEATNRVTHMATDISSKATGKWDKLENIFEDRVAKALNKLGVPSARDVDALIKRIDALSLQVKGTKSPAKAASPARKAVAAKAPAKKAAPRKAAASKTAVRKTPARKPAARKAAVSAPAEA
ncbi:phasin family protein [Hydrogenophaga sp. PAMC20947]|uniref:phasin family protein n=1 Tax=Hydrogenophaga sp. PAMC20947 TaxID=2565558 RepID=UPI00109E022D|nr:phasin family protein [Hydrogenophaga sp. PAMC20947]QCB48105.1 poly granule associated protein [Hydrogenophaga sp. PAMC20947]